MDEYNNNNHTENNDSLEQNNSNDFIKNDIEINNTNIYEKDNNNEVSSSDIGSFDNSKINEDFYNKPNNENLNNDDTVEASNLPNRKLINLIFVFGILLIAVSLMLTVNLIFKPKKFENFTLYFSDFTYKKLIPEKRKLRKSDSRNKKLVLILNELINGPITNKVLPTLPSDLKILSTWITETTAYVNLDRKILYDLADNADAEIIAVYSIVNTIILNMNGIKKVQLLVEDIPLKTIRGLTRVQNPLTIRKDLCLGIK